MSAAAQPNPTDKLAQLVSHEIRRDAQRIANQEPNLDQLKREMAMTVLPLVQELGSEVMRLRSWANECLNQHADQLDDHEVRLDVIEQEVTGDESRLEPEDAELFAKLAAACEAFAEEALRSTTDPDGRKKLEEVLAMAKQAGERLGEIEAAYEDDDDDEEPEASSEAEEGSEARAEG